MSLVKLKRNNDQYYLIIQYHMSKKAQQPKEAPKPVIDEENEPFLRALQKKVRNINKKLTQITELEAKENLKPEQIQKINRKDALIEERSRIDETATLFRENYAENIAVYRAAQLKELETVARALAILHSGAKLPQSGRLTALWQALKGDSNAENLNASITSLSNALKSFADDRKLQKSLSAYVEAHGNEKIQKPLPREEKVEVAVAEVKSEPVREPEPVAVVQPEVKAVSEVKTEEKIAEVPQASVEAASNVEIKAESTPAEKVEETKVEVKPEETAREGNERRDNRGGNRERGGNRDNRDNRGRGDRRPRGDYRRRDNEQPRERRQYKPKNGEREPEPEQRGESSSDSEPEQREFRREEIRKLEDEGFIVVGKPKPKAKDPKEVRTAHDRQHGKKHHHHGQPSNY